MKKKEKIIACWLVVMTLLMCVSIVPVQPAKAQFVISAYTYDESNNGHYIAFISAYYDGVHNGTIYYNPISHPNDTASDLPKELYIGTNLTIYASCWLNGTHAGIGSLSEGLNVIRHNVTVVCNNGSVVFSQQNFTNTASTDGNAPMYFYVHGVIIDFEFVQGEIYTVIITYEVFY